LVAHITRNFYRRKNLRFQLKYLVQKILDTNGCFCPYMAPARFMKPCAPSHICDKHSHTVGSSLESLLSPQIFKLARQPMPSQKYRYWLQLTCGKYSTAWWLLERQKRSQTKVPNELRTARLQINVFYAQTVFPLKCETAQYNQSICAVKPILVHLQFSKFNIVSICSGWFRVVGPEARLKRGTL